MNLERFTLKAQTALQDAQKVAQEHQNQEIDGEHLLEALINQEDGLVRPLLEKLGVPVQQLLADLEQAIAKRVKVQGITTPDTFLGNTLKKALDSAEAQAAKLKDE